MKSESLDEAVALIEDISNLAHVVLSGRRRNFIVEHERIDIRPVEIKSTLNYQMIYSDGRKVTTKNFEVGELNIEKLLLGGYSNITIRHSAGEFSARFTKKDELLVSQKAGAFSADTSHDRKKARLLDSNNGFLKLVGISDDNGVIKPSKSAKYKQIEEFLRLVAPEIMKLEEPITIADLGSGSGYLTFAIHQYLTQEGKKVVVTGIDNRSEFEEKNSKIAETLGISSTIKFITTSIADAPALEANVVIALHACDTATDDALAWAIKVKAQAIFVAPCCQHDIQKQMKTSPEPWGAITSHGILKERLGDLITDALRIEILKSQGFSCDAIEFVGGEHTPRNVMIRAIYTGQKSDLTQYEKLTSQWGVESALQRTLTNR